MAKRKGCPAGILHKDEGKWWITNASACGFPGKTGPWTSKKKAIDSARSFGYKSLLDESPGVMKSKKWPDGKVILLEKKYSKEAAKIDIINSPFSEALGWAKNGRLTKAGREVAEQYG